MSYYESYNFVSPEPTFAIVKEELKSYFDTGMVDDLLFPTYLDKCLRKLGKTTYKIFELPIVIQDFSSRLPDNFHSVREAWMCTEINGYPYQSANSFYSQAASATTIQVSPVVIAGKPCNNPSCHNPKCDGCMPNLVQAVYKTNNEVAITYQKRYMLKPGNISARKNCDVSYNQTWEDFGQAAMDINFTPNSSSYDSFDIRDNRFVTNFRNAVVHLVFYATDYDDGGSQLVPDNYRVLEYIEHFLKYKMFETISNQVTDETFNQLQQKLQYYKMLCDEAYILAEVEIKKQTAWEKQRRIVTTLNRNNRYELPNRNRSGRFFGRRKGN